VTVTIRPLEPMGAEVLGADVDALLHDPEVPAVVHSALEQHGVLIFHELGLDDASQVAFARRLGDIAMGTGAKGYGRSEEMPEVYHVGFAKDLNNEVQVRGAFDWHMDGTTDPIPSMASLLTARSLASDGGGDTQFVSTYAAYERLTDEQKAMVADLKVEHGIEPAYRRFEPDPSPEVLDRIRQVPTRLHPLVWQHRTGRRSLVLGATAGRIDGMGDEEGRALLEELLAGATEPEHVLTYRWSIGDMVIWDNRGDLHRATHYGEGSGRMMHRVTLVGDEAIQ
jgi:alpha-ketoglutarate-dependent taurine dioxygenase